MAKKGSRRAVKTGSVSEQLTAGLPRIRKASRRQKRKFYKKTVRTYGPVPGSFRLVGEVLTIFRKHWRVLAGIVFIYVLLNIIFASGLSNVGSAFDDIKINLEAQGGGHLLDALGGFGILVASAGASTSETASVLQGFLLILESLVIIWALRHLLAGQKFRVKEAYYNSMTPLIPFLLVIFMIVIQLLPVTLGSVIAGTVLSSIFASTPAVVAVISIVIFLLALWSIYMVSGSIFALYVVTLPEMQPRDALRSAKNLVRFRRWTVIRRLVFLPLFILAVIGIIIVPMILYADTLVTPVFYLLVMLAILFVHSYLYSLYRGLLE